MKVTGFTFIRNAIKYDYPVVEAIKSIMPVCDDFIVAVGKSEDATLELILGIDPHKIRIINTVWDDSLREGGRVLAEETNKAFRAISPESDWAFYIQGDEVVHEKYLDTIRSEMEKWKNDSDVDGLLFKYTHFYGSYDYVGASSKWYNKEIRVIKNDKSIYSYRDAQGFRKGENLKLKVKQIDAFVYHYGWVKQPEAMQRKQLEFNKLWHDDQWIENNVVKSDEFDYSNIDVLELFKESHPQVMQQKIVEKNWKFEHDLSINRSSLKNRVKRFFRKYLGIELGYKNYKIV